MSMPALRPRRWTIDEVEHLIDQREGMSPRYELVDSELLVTPGTGRAPSANRSQPRPSVTAIRLARRDRRDRLGPSLSLARLW